LPEKTKILDDRSKKFYERRKNKGRNLGTVGPSSVRRWDFSINLPVK